MLKSIEFNSHIRNRLAAYLKGRGLDFQTAMREEKGNKEIASIIHGGLPVLVRKLYSEQKNAEVFLGKAGFDCRLHQPPDAGIGG